VCFSKNVTADIFIDKNSEGFSLSGKPDLLSFFPSPVYSHQPAIKIIGIPIGIQMPAGPCRNIPYWIKSETR